MNKKDLTLNDQHWLISHKTKPKLISLSLSVVICHYKPSLWVDPLGNIQYPHRSDVYKFLLDTQYWCNPEKESTEERR